MYAAFLLLMFVLSKAVVISRVTVTCAQTFLRFGLFSNLDVDGVLFASMKSSFSEPLEELYNITSLVLTIAVASRLRISSFAGRSASL